jgi:hypothetical protein
MGKYYSRYGKNLYIYVTRNDVLIDLKYFPPELNLFTTNSAWRIKDTMAIVNDANEEDLDKAEIILSLNSYKRGDIPEETLELFYNEGNERVLEKPLPEKPMTPVATETPRKRGIKDMEVIIPEAKSPIQPLTPEEVAIEPSKTTEGVVIPTTTPTQTQSIPRSEDELVERIIDRLQRGGVIPPYTQIPTPPQSQPRPTYTATEELNRLLIEMLRKQMGSEEKEKPEAPPIDGLLAQLTEYLRSMTLDTTEIEKPPIVVLISALTEYLKSNTPEKRVQPYVLPKQPTEKTQEITEEQAPQRKIPQVDALKAISQYVVGDAPSPWPKEHGVEKETSTEYIAEMRTELEQFYLDLTYSKYNNKIRNRQIQNFNYLTEHWERLAPLINEIAEDPLYVMTTKTVRKPVEEGSLNTETLGLFLSQIRGLSKDDGEVIIPARIPIMVSGEEEAPDYDVPQNRMLKSHLESVETQILDLLESLIESEGYLRRAISRSKGPKTDELAESLVDNKQLKNVLISLKKRTEELSEKPRMAFLRDAQPGNGKNEDIPFTELAYIKMSELIEAFEITAQKPTPKIDKDISPHISAEGLYTKWCLMKIHDVLAELGYGHVSNKLGEDEGEFRVDIKEGSEMTLSREKNTVTLVYGSIHRSVKVEEPKNKEIENNLIVLKAFKGEKMTHVRLFLPKYHFSNYKQGDELNTIQTLNIEIGESLNIDHTNLKSALLTTSKKDVGEADDVYILTLSPGDDRLMTEYIRNITES